MQLYKLSNELIEIQNKIESGELLPEDMLDTIEGIEGEFEDKAENVIKFIKSQKAYADALKAEYDALKKRAEAAKKSAEKMQEYLANELHRLNKNEVKAGVFTAKFRKPVQVVKVLSDPPDEYNTIEIKPNVAMIKLALKNGEQLDFARLVDGKETLMIK